MNFKKENEWFYLGIVCVAAIVSILPIAVWGIPSGADVNQHFQFAQTFYDSLMRGDGFPGWSDQENSGYGGIGIRFYPPFAYYVFAVVRMLAGNWYDAAWLTFMFWMILGCAGIYFWARWWFFARESAVAAVFYAFVPYHINQLYNSFIYADFAGASVLIFCFAFLTRAMRREKTSDLIGLTVAYALLILTHLPTTVIGSLCLAVYALLLFRRENLIRRIIKLSAAISVALAASAFYWVKMVSEMSWLSHATDKFSTNHYGFQNRFFPLYFTRLEVDFKEGLITADVMFAFTALFLISAVIYLFYRKTESADTDDGAAQIFRTVLPLGLFGFLMATPLSAPLWKLLPPLQKVQFPWRWFSIVAICGAVVAAAAVHFLFKGNFLEKRAWLYISVTVPMIIMLFNGVYIFNPIAFVPIARADFEIQMSDLPAKESCACWWSIWAKDDAFNIREKVLAETREITVTNWQAEERSFTVEEGAATAARIATFYYPRWQATVNDAPVEIGKDASGVMLVPLPAGRASVKLSFQEPPIHHIAALISLAAWLLIFLVSLFTAREKLAYFRTSETYFVEEKVSC